MLVKTARSPFFYKFPVPVRGRKLLQNDFLEVELLDRKYYLSVLPHFHEPSLIEVEYKIKYFFENYSLDFSKLDFSKRFFNLVASEDSFLQAIHKEHLFFIETLLFNLCNHPAEGLIPLNSLYDKTKSLEENASQPCLKIKLRPDTKSQLECLHLISELLKINPEIVIRLDGNRQFEISEMLRFDEDLRSHIGDIRLDYIEEPFKNFYDTFSFRHESDLTLALDESAPLYLESSDNLNKIPLHFPLILKPSLIGISPIYKWLISDERKKRRAIISTSFEHPTIMPGHFFLANEANKHGSIEFHGLENYLV
jgi:hypothetical protein